MMRDRVVASRGSPCLSLSRNRRESLCCRVVNGKELYGLRGTEIGIIDLVEPNHHFVIVYRDGCHDTNAEAKENPCIVVQVVWWNNGVLDAVESKT